MCGQCHSSRSDGTDGMETAEIIKGVVRETKPDLLIVIDALAARNSRRLNRTIRLLIPESIQAPVSVITGMRLQKKQLEFR